MSGNTARGRGTRALQQSLLAPRQAPALPTEPLPQQPTQPTQRLDLPERAFYPRLERWGGLDVHRFPTNNCDIFLRIAPERRGVVIGSILDQSLLIHLSQQEALVVYQDTVNTGRGLIRAPYTSYSPRPEMRYRIRGTMVHVSLHRSWKEDDTGNAAVWKKQMPLEAWESLLEDFKEVGEQGDFTDVLPQRNYRPTPSPLLPTTRSTLASELLRQRR